MREIERLSSSMFVTQTMFRLYIESLPLFRVPQSFGKPKLTDFYGWIVERLQGNVRANCKPGLEQ